ncbi:phage portal protein, partial [Persephonella sp.]
MSEKKTGFSKVEVKNFFGNIINREMSLTDIPSISALFALYGYKGLASACIDVISNAVASNEWYLLKPKNRRKKGSADSDSRITKSRRPLPDEIVSEEDDVYKLLMRPNPVFNWYEHIQYHQVFMEIKGEAYWYLARDGLNRVREIWLIPPFFVQPVKSTNKNAHPYEIEKYIVNTVAGAISVDPDDMIYFRNPNPYNPIRGIGTLEKAVIERDLNIFSKLYARNFFKNGGIPAGILISEQKIPEDELEQLK